MLRLSVVTVVALLQPVLSAPQGTTDEAFASTVISYVNLHRSAESGLPSARATDPATTQGLEAALALRPNAAPGDVLGPLSGRIRAIVSARSLVLLDTRAGLVVDVLPDVLPVVPR